jgi:hypothetical protein
MTGKLSSISVFADGNPSHKKSIIEGLATDLT